MKSEYEGLRCVGLVRTSTKGQTENGIQQQLEACHRFAEAKGMIWVDAERAPGVSAYQTQDRDDIERIIARRRAGEDFQVVVVFDYSRLTRGGVDHGSFLLWQFTQVGLSESSGRPRATGARSSSAFETSPMDGKSNSIPISIPKRCLGTSSRT